MREVSNLMQNSTAVNGDPTAVISTGTGTSSYREDNMLNNEDNGDVNPLPENQSECDSRVIEKNLHTSRGEATPPSTCPSI